jgi:16S rRNA (adenine1518-N6/adenine1519-N6)-dimethyltransferase
MNAPPGNVKDSLFRHGIRPKKKFGQNFLVDKAALQAVIAAGELRLEDMVLEIGAGPGNLTALLVDCARQVVAVEIDRRFLPMLTEIQQAHGNLRVIPGDILKLSSKTLGLSKGYVVVANLPYYITSAVIRHLLEDEVKPFRLVLTVQVEVAERICSKPGRLSLLALSVQVYGSPTVVGRIPAAAFFPIPKVDSAIIKVDIHPAPAIPASQLELFFTLAKAGFSQRRKTLRNALSAGMHLDPHQTEARLIAAGIDPMRRAETLSMAEWKILTAFWNAHGE